MSGPTSSDPGSTEADLVHAAVLRCAGVAALSAGTFGEIRSYLPGRTVPGVKVSDEAVEVHIVAHYGPPVTTVAEQVRSALATLLAGRQLLLDVDDILLPGEAIPDEPPESWSPAAASHPSDS